VGNAHHHKSGKLSSGGQCPPYWFNHAKLSLAMLIEPKYFGSGYKPEPAKDDKFKCFLHCKFRFHFKGLFKFINWWALPTLQA